MGIKQVCKGWLQDAFWRMGFDFRRRNDLITIPNLSACLERLSKRGHPFNSVVDIGASNGSWSQELMRFYPSAQYLLVEAQPVHEQSLRAFCQKHTNAQYILTAAGAEETHIYFDSSDPFGGVASYVPPIQNAIQVPVASLDYLVYEKYHLDPPYLLKLDTHGFEVPIFTGATKTLKQTSAIIVECYNFKITPETLTFPEMCLHLEKYGFRCMDMFDFIFRPKDGALWQMDILFMRNDRPEFSSLEFS